MSYSISTKVDAGQDVATAVDNAFDASPTAREVAGPHADVARDAAGALAAAVRRAEDSLMVSISGHHNPDCQPVTGWASCAINVSVTQVYPPTP